MDTTDAVTFTGVTKTYGTVTALDHVDFRVGVGESVAMLGPNGAGKSTAVDIMLGLRHPGSGIVRVLGGSPAQAVATGRVAGMPQIGGLPTHARVREVVDLVRRLYSSGRDLAALLATTALTDLAGRRVERLSGGQAQRVRLALALAGSPDLLFLDEPTVALDVESRRRFWSVVRRVAETGTSVVFATHHLDEADANADRIVVLSGGRVVADDTPAAIKSRTGEHTVRCVLDDPDPALLLALPGVTNAATRGRAVALRTTDPDATVAALYALGRPVTGLRISGADLEDALLALTAKDA